MAAGPIVIEYKMAVTTACNDWNPLLSHDKSVLSKAAVAAELVYFMLHYSLLPRIFSEYVIKCHFRPCGGVNPASTASLTLSKCCDLSAKRDHGRI